MICESDILNGKILIVDDQVPNVQLLEQMLSEAGYRCVSATLDPFVVCELHRINNYDLILLDLQMPGMDGFQVMEGLKGIETEGYIPILVITAKPSQKLLALALGAKDFITKPFDLVEVKLRIHNLLEVRLLYKQLEQYNQVLKPLALHDPLTGLPNRRLLVDRLTLSIAHALRNKCTIALMYLDLDGFKLINDSFGHVAGDTLLTMVASRLEASVRKEDTVARLGGDEFMIALTELSHEDVECLALKIIHAVSQPYTILGHVVSITASIGVSIYPINGEVVEALMKFADLAMYEAKRTGKNKYCIAANSEVLDVSSK